MQNYIIISLIVMVLMCGCVSERTVLVDDGPIKMFAFFDKCTTIIEFFNAMGAMKFHYENEWNDANYYTDEPTNPVETFERKYTNCRGYALFTATYIQYKRNCDSYTRVLMTERNLIGVVVKWHEISIIKVDGKVYQQSNTELREVESEQVIFAFWASQGYQTFQEIDKWVK